MRLRYLGSTPTTFAVLGLEVAPGDEFDVDDSAAAAYTARADVEAVDPPKSRRKSKADSAHETATDAPDAGEVADAVPDDH